MSNNSIEDIYQKKTQLEHIKDLPDTYIGSIENTEHECWIHNNNKIVRKTIQYIPGLYKIYDEIIVNAIDHSTRLLYDDKEQHKVTQIKVNIDKTNNIISVYNNGEGIPAVIHKKHNVHIPELIFGNLLTSANYNKNEKKITGGKNGFGSKLTNIFSTEFYVETVDSKNKLKYVQTFSNNMDDKTKPKITKCSRKPYTLIRFKPDLKIFGINEISDDMVALMEKRVIDITACTPNNVSVYLNDSKINCKTLEDYTKYYFNKKMEYIYNANERWEIVVIVNPDARYEQISFVNGIHTVKGGKHVDSAVSSVCRKLQAYVKKHGYKRKKNPSIKQVYLKDNMFIFVKSIIEDPSFDSQIKEFLTTPISKFGSKCEIDPKNIEKLAKTSLIERAMKLNDFKDTLNIPKNKLNNKKSVIRGISKLDDANFAGTKKSFDCTLILTEGDSAKALAISGLSVIGRDYFGVFPLKGKLLNVRDVSLKKVSTNTEINNIMKILGLNFNMYDKETDKQKRLQILKEKLRYGRVLIFTDQDVDGSHIKGLVINFFHSLWPELLELNTFIISLATPIVKITKGKKVKSFYTLTEFDDWKKLNEKGWKVKYYKGLGTSTSKEAKEYFKDFENKKINYIYSDDIQQSNNKTVSKSTDININDEECITFINACQQSLELAFLKENSDKRKKWLKQYNKEIILEQDQKKIEYNEFINKEFIHFSNSDCQRSIGSLCDGLKPSQRKVLFSILKKPGNNEVKVSQFAGYVSEQSAYHHGENSLYECIIKMAQNFVGSNNINLLEPNGQFGTRLQGGKDASAPRYIWTKMAKLTNILFNENDNPLLKYNFDDGIKVEPEWYIPILPLVLINGTEGIGTGFSTKIPSHNPLDIIRNIMNIMDKKPYIEMKPWYRKFKGEINPRTKDSKSNKSNQYQSEGKFRVLNKTSIEITELPVGVWTDNYKEFLDSIIFDKQVETRKQKKQCITGYKSYYTESDVKFVLTFRKADLDKFIKNNSLPTLLKLTETKNTSYTNMHLYNREGTIQKYSSAKKILMDFYKIRLEFYGKRKEYLLNKYNNELIVIGAKIKFINEFINKDIDIINQEDEDIYNQLKERDYPIIDGDEKFDYLLNMSIRTLTKKRMTELQKQFDIKTKIKNDLMKKTKKKLWKEDIMCFLNEYTKK